MFPEMGPVWQWVRNNRKEVLSKVDANYMGDGPGAIRKIAQENLDELNSIFEVTGAKEWFRKIEEKSATKAIEMGMEIDDGKKSTYFREVYTKNSQSKHVRP
jgi:heterodisulfide reductase subunit C